VTGPERRADAPPGTPLLETEHLSVSYPRGRRRPPLVAVDDISLRLSAGRTLGVVGESGSGKSSLGAAVLGLVPVADGAIRFRGRDTTRLPVRERRRLTREMQAVFQDPFGSLNPTRTIGATLTEPLVLNLGWSRGDARRRAVEVLDRVGLPPASADRFPAQFSGGQRQRIAIARALAMSPALVVCDEPVSALDLSVQAQILNLLAELQDELGLSYLFISHDLGVVRHVCHDVLVMYRGRVVEAGPTEEVYARPAHPYTRALLAAVPLPDPAGQQTRRALRRTTTTEVVAPTPEGGGRCVFSPRCPFAVDACRRQAPPLLPRDGDRSVACLRYDDVRAVQDAVQ
jgi:oligopeptide/dipeptide ABC transporter ATP-binding protein